jgi:hypothetical protein
MCMEMKDVLLLSYHAYGIYGTYIIIKKTSHYKNLDIMTHANLG